MRKWAGTTWLPWGHATKPGAPWHEECVKKAHGAPTLMPALRHLPTASGTAARGGSIMEMSPTKQRFSTGKFTSSVSNWNPSGYCSSGRKRWQKPARRAAGGLWGQRPLVLQTVYLWLQAEFRILFQGRALKPWGFIEHVRRLWSQKNHARDRVHHQTSKDMPCPAWRRRNEDRTSGLYACPLRCLDFANHVIICLCCFL